MQQSFVPGQRSASIWFTGIVQKTFCHTNVLAVLCFQFYLSSYRSNCTMLGLSSRWQAKTTVQPWEQSSWSNLPVLLKYCFWTKNSNRMCHCSNFVQQNKLNFCETLQVSQNSAYSAEFCKCSSGLALVSCNSNNFSLLVLPRNDAFAYQ